MAKDTGFYFQTTYKDADGNRDETVYFAHLIDHEYRVVVEKGNLTATVDFSLQEVYNKWVSGEWLVVRQQSNKE